MRHYLTAAAMCSVLLLAASCKKDDGNTTTTAKNNTWKLGATSYIANNYAKLGGSFQVYDTVGNGLIFSFSTFPAADGSYKVVDRSATLGPQDVNVSAFSATLNNTYFSTAASGTTAIIKVISASRLRISLPDTKLVRSGADTLVLSAELGDL